MKLNKAIRYENNQASKMRTESTIPRCRVAQLCATSSVSIMYSLYMSVLNTMGCFFLCKFWQRKGMYEADKKVHPFLKRGLPLFIEEG